MVEDWAVDKEPSPKLGLVPHLQQTQDQLHFVVAHKEAQEKQQTATVTVPAAISALLFRMQWDGGWLWFVNPDYCEHSRIPTEWDWNFHGAVN